MIDVVTGLFLQGDKVLLTQRLPNKNYPSHWEIGCGGKCEPGETWPETLVREVREEIGVAAVAGDHLDTAAFPELGFQCVLYRCTGDVARARNLEVAQHRWVPVEEVLTYLLTPSGPRFYPVVVREVVKEMQARMEVAEKRAQHWQGLYEELARGYRPSVPG